MNIWVAGSDGGIGSSIVSLLQDGHTVYGSKMPEVNVTDIGSVHHWCYKRPPFDALVYAVGINHLAWSRDIVPADMLDVYNVNVVGLVRCLKSAENVRRVVVIGSDAARRPMRTSIAYNASKAALEAAVKVIARERADQDFVINVVAPGLIANTAMTDYVLEETSRLRPGFDLQSYMIDGIPASMPGKKLDVARVTKWLLESAPRYLNGAVIDVNGAR
jgi:NAD(P)-dependent dehydrogenase (short-subunit alcohol dehydrogenase family)